jgi:hypothetical protein
MKKLFTILSLTAVFVMLTAFDGPKDGRTIMEKMRDNVPLYTDYTGTFNGPIGGVTPAAGTFTDVYANTLQVGDPTYGSLYIGSYAGYYSSTEPGNTAVGVRALDGMTGSTTGEYNTGIGIYAGQYLTNGGYNTAIGAYALPYVTTGTNNIALGWEAGQGTTSSSRGIFIGNHAGAYIGSNSGIFNLDAYGDGRSDINDVQSSSLMYGVMTSDGNSQTLRINGNLIIPAIMLDGTQITANGTEINYTDGLTGNIQTLLDAKAATSGPTFTGTVTMPSTTSIGNVSSTELGYVDGVTSAIQTQLNSKEEAHATPSITTGTNDITCGASEGDMTSMSVSFTPTGSYVLIMFSAPFYTTANTTYTIFINVGGANVRKSKQYNASGQPFNLAFQHIAAVTPGTAVTIKIRWSGGTTVQQRGSTDSERILTVCDL